ncbi:MAG: LysR family transcriptional regulator [Gammaproteobacteria bacterium]|nr:LysR family transcriptional regulator [Gammaproteobacteria bacterium]
MDKLGHMRTLVTVAKLGSFSAAAKELGGTPGMMSKQVKQLEDTLDVRLLHRTTRGVSLTDAGELFVERAVGILQQIDDVETAVTGLSRTPRGVLRVNSPPSFGTHVLTPIIAGFLARYPDMRVELGLQDDEPNVIASRLDLIFRLGKLRDSSLVSRQVGRAPFVLCAAPAYLAAHGEPRGIADLAEHNCIVDGSIQTDGSWSFADGDGKRITQGVQGSFASLSTEAVIEAAAAGVGLVYVPRYAVTEELEQGELAAIDLDDAAPVAMPIYALYGSRDHVAAKLRDFLDFFLAHFDGHSGRHVSQDGERESGAANAGAPVSPRVVRVSG